jgi:hypothetical protein
MTPLALRGSRNRDTERYNGRSHPIVETTRSTSMMNGMMDSMMGWIMGLGLLGWILLIAVLATVMVLLDRLLGRPGSRNDKVPPSSA